MSFFKGLFPTGFTKKSRILSKVKKLKRTIEPFGKQPLITVEAPSINQKKLTSHILKIGYINGTPSLVLDSFIPDEVNNQFKNNTTLKVTLKKKGITVTFQTTIYHIRMENDIPLYLCSVPNVIKEDQLRSSHRVHVTRFFRVPVTIYSTGRSSIKGFLDDLSIHGAGIIIKENVMPPFNIGEIIDGCYITLPDNEAVQCQIEVKQYRRKLGGTKILGATFLNIKGNGKDSIDKLMVECNRLEIKAKKGG